MQRKKTSSGLEEKQSHSCGVKLNKRSREKNLS